MNLFTVAAMGLVLAMGATPVYAPETGPLDEGRVHDVAYSIEENGRIVDKDGTPKGWMVGDEVYGNSWTLKYRMEGRKIGRVPEL